MSDETQDKDILLLQNNYLHMTKQINDLEITVKDGFTDLKKDLKIMRMENDERYAEKRIEKTVDKLIWLVISSVVLAGIALIIVK